MNYGAGFRVYRYCYLSKLMLSAAGLPGYSGRRRFIHGLLHKDRYPILQYHSLDVRHDGWFDY